MNKKDNIVELYKIVKKENEELLKERASLLEELAILKRDDNDNWINAKIFNDSLKELNELKNKLKKELEEVELIKNKYKNDLKSMIENL